MDLQHLKLLYTSLQTTTLPFGTPPFSSDIDASVTHLGNLSTFTINKDPTAYKIARDAVGHLASLGSVSNRFGQGSCKAINTI